MILMMYLSVCLVYLSDPVRAVPCGGRTRESAGGGPRTAVRFTVGVFSLRCVLNIAQLVTLKTAEVQP